MIDENELEMMRRQALAWKLSEGATENNKVSVKTLHVPDKIRTYHHFQNTSHTTITT
jgi:hypothetical protein